MARNKRDEIAEIKVKSVSERVVLNNEAQRLLHFLIEQHPPSRLSKNLRRLLLHSLMSDGGLEGPYLEDLLYDLEALFDFIDEVEFTIVEE